MHLLQRLPSNPLDIIGDVHGELAPLRALLGHLGYDANGVHADHRKIVFVGDLCDRGPESLGVVRLVQHLVERENAYVIVGNHEINLLMDDAKDGSGWFFEERYQPDLRHYAPFQRIEVHERQAIKDFLGGLPVALYRDDLRVVHAAWTTPAIDAIKNVPLGQLVEQFKVWDGMAQAAAEASGLYARYLHEKHTWSAELENADAVPPFLEAIAEYEATQQMINPIKILTSGVEARAETPFFASNRWRFSDRVSWWDAYDETVPVVVGHYWRLFSPLPAPKAPGYGELFSDIAGTAWHGKRQNVFCIDFSIGARWRDRKQPEPMSRSRFRLAALRWPENFLVFDSGETVATTGFRG